MKKNVALLVVWIVLFQISFAPANEKPVVKVKKFEFTGIKRTPQEDLKKISAKYISSPLLGEWPDQMLSEIKKIPIVKDAHLIRDLTGNVRIQIIERVPIASLFVDQFYWIDEQAKAIQTADTGKLEGMVFFSGPWKSLSEYQKKTGSDVIKQGLRLYFELANQGFSQEKISELHFDANLGWIMYRMGSRAPIVFGTQNLFQKAQRFASIVPHLEPFEGAILRIDTDFHDRVIVKLAGNDKKLK